jgi:hypothetical protein
MHSSSQGGLPGDTCIKETQDHVPGGVDNPACNNLSADQSSAATALDAHSSPTMTLLMNGKVFAPEPMVSHRLWTEKQTMHVNSKGESSAFGLAF